MMILLPWPESRLMRISDIMAVLLELSQFSVGAWKKVSS